MNNDTLNARYVLYGGYDGSHEDICHNAESIGEALFNKLRSKGETIVLIDGLTGYEVSARELLSKAVHLAQYLQTIGIESGDAITVCSENRIEFCVTIHAILYIGATVAPVNISYTENEMNHAINLSKPKIIFTAPSYLQKTIAVAQRNNFINHIILYDDNFKIDVIESIERTNILSFSKIMTSMDSNQVNQFKCPPQNMRECVGLILCSSGTTGLPKGVEITHLNMFSGANQYIKRKQNQEHPPSGIKIIMGNLPMYHAFGISVFYTMCLNDNNRIVLIPRFTEEIFLKSIQIYRITTCYLVPPIMVILAKSPLVPKYDLSSIQVIWCGAAPLSKKLEVAVKNRIGVKHVRQGYGMTEGTFAFIAQDDDHHTHGSVGVLNKGVYGRVVDIETGQLLGPNQKGELHFTGICIMKGYIGNTDATKDTIDENGWLHTGDIGYYDENGEWYIVDRIKELIKYKAFQVPPAEIEALLLTNPQINDAGVIGVPNEESGETAFAFVVKQPGSTITEKDVIRFVAERLSNPKRLHGGVKFVDAIPKSPTGKILRRVLREMVNNFKSKL